jgi:hypothetical protein
VLAAMLAAAALLEVAARFGLVGSPFGALVVALTEGSYSVSSALAGSFLVEYVERPQRRSVILLAGIALASIQLVLWRTYQARTLGFLFFNLPTSFGIVALLSRAYDAVRAPRNARLGGPHVLVGARQDALDALATTLLLPVFCVVAEKGLATLLPVYPATLDGGLFLADRALGPAPSYAVGRIVQHNGLLKRLVDIVYIQLPFAFVVVDLATAKTRTRDHRLLREFVLYGAASFLLLPIVPASGPRYAFADFPEVIPSNVTTWVLVPQWAFRNCVPSMHMTWALLLYHRARHGHAALRAFATFWLTFTVLATLGKGEHYVVDLVVAFPFLLVLETSRSPSVALVTGAVTLFTWLGALRFAAPLLAANPRATLAAEIATVVVCGTLTWRINATARIALEPASPPGDIAPSMLPRRDAA